jgi:hypothetical protein
MNNRYTCRIGWVAALMALSLAACDNMQHQENSRAFAPSRQFANDSSARTPPPHTVSRTAPAPGDVLSTGLRDGHWITGFPIALTPGFVRRGGDRYDIFCSDCHGVDGAGLGIVVARGFPMPASFDEAKMRQEPSGALFAAISHGSGAMYGFADRINLRDRWAIVAYIRALQKSRNATLAEVPDAERVRLSER